MIPDSGKRSVCPRVFPCFASSSTTDFSLSYNWVLPNGKNNASVYQIQNNRDNTRSLQYSYDPMNRLATAGTYNATTWGDAYVYDNWGNLLQKNPTQGTGESLQVTTDVHNHINTSGFKYDAAGNLTWDGANALKFDAENHMNPATGYVYSYDGDDLRVEKNYQGSITYYWYDDNAQVISTTGVATNDYVYFAGRRIAFEDSAGNQHYYWSDHLGSAGVLTNSNGSAIQWEADYYPFGTKRVITNNLTNYYLFTGYQFDYETGYNYAIFREQSPNLGRFMSADPMPGDISNPQSLNRYAYVLNNPLRAIDPLGLECVWDDGSFDSADDPETGNGQGCEDQGGTYIPPDLFENSILTNGQNANIQYGSWSDQANPTIASSWTVPSGTAYGSQWAAGQEVDEALDLYYGNGAKPTIIYTQNDPFTLSFQTSMGMQGILAGVASNCSATSGQVSIGTGEAFVNTMIDGPYLQQGGDGSVQSGWSSESGYYTPEAQMGAFNSTYTRSGGVVDITVTNPISLNSQAFHMTVPLGIKNPTSGHFGTVHQVLLITAADPCR